MNSLKTIAVCTGIFMAHNALAQNVGIGTATPTEKLHVVGGARITSLSGTGYRLVRADANGVLSTIADGTTTGQVLTTNASGTYSFQTLGGNNTLDMAYDEGGAGAGRIITADAGTVEINGTGGLWVNATTTTLSEAVLVNNSDGTNSTDTKIGWVGTSGTSIFTYGVRGEARMTSATNVYDGGYGVFGTIRHPTDGTVNLNATLTSSGNSINKAVGVFGGVGAGSDYIGGPQDVIAGVWAHTGLHNSGNGSVTGGAKLYAGLFSGNGRTLGLWGENSTYMEFMPRWQVRDYDVAVLGFYNSDPDGGNNDADIGTGDTYFSIEANVTDATVKHVTMQTRTSGNVGIGTATPSEKLHVAGGARITSLSGVNNRLVQSNATGVLSNIADGISGQVLTTDGAGVLSWGASVAGSWDILGNAGTNPASNFLGTTDAQDLVLRTNNNENFRINTSGNVDIGAALDDARVYARIMNTDATTNYGLYVYHAGVAAGTTYGTRTINYSSTNSTKYGIYNYTNNEGTGTRYGIYNNTQMNSASISTGYGTYNYLNSYGTGNHRAGYNYLNHSGTAVSTANYASYNLINIATSTNTSTLYGEYTDVDFSAGTSYGEYKEMNSNSVYTSSMYGDYNHMLGTGNGISYAVYNDFDNTGIGAKYGMRNEFADVAGTKYGVRNNFASGTATGNIYGVYNYIQADGNATKSGIYNYISGGDGALRGSYNTIYPASTNTSTIHGVYSYINSAGAGAHYGVYSNAPGGTNDYSGMFYAGNFVANEIGGDYDFRVETDTRTHAMFADAGNDLVRFGLATGSLSGNGLTVGGTVVDYVADFDAGGVEGTAVGIGSIEYLLDGNSRTKINNAFVPTTFITRDLGFSTTVEAWDDVYADNYVNVSDEREKKDIENLTYGLKEVMAMRPVSYILKKDPFAETKLGLIAQEALTLVPEAVKTHDHKILDESKPEEYTKIEMDRMGMTYNSLIPVLIKATQEQQGQIEVLKETFKNISDFGISSLSGAETFIPFNNDFKAMLTGTPVVAVTPINSTASLTIVNQTAQGFTIRINGEFTATDFNWVAMAKVKEDALETKINYIEAERRAMFSKINTENAKFNYDDKDKEASIRKLEAAAAAKQKSDALRKEMDDKMPANLPPVEKEEEVAPDPVKVVLPNVEEPEPEKEETAEASKIDKK